MLCPAPRGPGETGGRCPPAGGARSQPGGEGLLRLDRLPLGLLRRLHRDSRDIAGCGGRCQLQGNPQLHRSVRRTNCIQTKVNAVGGLVLYFHDTVRWRLCLLMTLSIIILLDLYLAFKMIENGEITSVYILTVKKQHGVCFIFRSATNLFLS